MYVHMENLPNGYFYYSYFTPSFLNRYFSELLLLAGDKKINKNYRQKLKPEVRLWALEITHWKLHLYGQLFCIRQTSQLSRFYPMSQAELCASLITSFEKLPNKLRGKSTVPQNI